MDLIKEIIYVPASFDFSENIEESDTGLSLQEHRISPVLIAERIIESHFMDSTMIHIYGEKIFMTDEISEFIRCILTNTKYQVSIHTKGIEWNETANFVESLRGDVRGKVIFNISVDTIDDIADSTTFNLQQKTIKYLSFQNIKMNIDTIVSKETVNNIEKIRECIAEMSKEKAKHNFIPYYTELGSNQAYEDTYVSAIWPYLSDYWTKLVVLLRDRINQQMFLHHYCSLTIGPDGKVYPGSVNTDYNSNDELCMGNLTKEALDEIWLSEKRDTVFEIYNKNCDGYMTSFNSICRISEEVLEKKLTSKDIEFMFSSDSLFQENKQWQNCILGYGWYKPETDKEGNKFCWMQGRKSTLLLHKTCEIKQCKLKFRHGGPVQNNMYLEVLSNNKIIYRDICMKGANEILLDISNEGNGCKLEMCVSDTWCPAEVFGTPDKRTLGIAITDIILC